MGQFEFNKLPFGATNATRSFQRVMNTIFSGCTFAQVYLDDILIFSKNKEEHVKHINEVLRTLNKNWFAIYKEKSNFLKNVIKYLGCKINEFGISPDISKMESFEIKSPTTIKQLQKLLGFLNYFREFVTCYSRKLFRITEKLKGKNKTLYWDNIDQKNIQAIKEEIISEITLNHPDLNNPFVLKTDACDKAFGAVLLQNNKPIRFFRYKLKGSELNYTIMKKELFSIV